MKKYVNIFSLIIAIAGFYACNDAFMDKFPETEITAEGFFKTPTDLETYVNGLYNRSLIHPRNVYWCEKYSDNIAHLKNPSDEDGANYSMLKGNYSKNNAIGWSQQDWSILRSVNVLLANAGNATGNAEDIRHWIGIGRYFRAMFYIEYLSKYSNVPWYNTPLSSNDPDLYRPSDPRTLVADSIKADLEYASVNIKPDLYNRTTVNRYAALTLLTRFCLYEGTYRKYHAELSLESTANAFLERAVTAAEQVMNSGVFSITGKGRAGFTALFTSADLSSNAEIIMMQNFEQGKGTGNRSNDDLRGDHALSRSLMESFLMADGSRFTEQPDFDKKEFKEVFVDRDPRIYETFVTPGFQKATENLPYVVYLEHGGYEAVKNYPRDVALLGGGDNLNFTDQPVYRYAEVLLSYAEAKAELGTLTQADLDASINVIRARVSIPPLDMAAANSNSSIDPVLEDQYPNVSGANKGVILEIRRERRVEMALEGRRIHDLHRWFVGDLVARAPQGMYIPKFGAYDLNGDNNPDVAFLQDPDHLEPIADLTPERQQSIPKIFLSEQAFYLSEGDKGFIMFSEDRDLPRHWESPKFYYRPIPVSQEVLNENLSQVFGW